MNLIFKSGRVISSLSRKGFVMKVKSAVKKVVDCFLNKIVFIGNWASQKLEIRNPVV